METFKIIEVPQHRAVNLGSWLVPEKWMFDSSSELWVNTTTANDLYTLSLELGQMKLQEELSRIGTRGSLKTTLLRWPVAGSITFEFPWDIGI